ncbi:putative F-box protein At3g58860 [Papaver somniferum]|uniref:putative F-box protein At3g58860 n=1 Tax=Papaver somniferum TaxID=3469 RepID=UPI000E703CA6|nr:putative F-box protein At3g58860 [Papaver somniferum]
MDRISELPDFLIQHVLSFLPTKFVVSTTVLSKRWKNLRIHVPTLDFSDCKEYTSDDEGKTERFMDFVDRLLILPNMSPVHKFRLVYDRENGHFDPVREKEWIATAVKCKVEEVFVSMGYPEDTLPDSLFTSESLIKLDIHFPDDNDYYETMLSVP